MTYFMEKKQDEVAKCSLGGAQGVTAVRSRTSVVLTVLACAE